MQPKARRSKPRKKTRKQSSKSSVQKWPCDDDALILFYSIFYSPRRTLSSFPSRYSHPLSVFVLAVAWLNERCLLPEDIWIWSLPRLVFFFFFLMIVPLFTYFLNSVGVIGFFVTWVFYMDLADKPFDLHAMLWWIKLYSIGLPICWNLPWRLNESFSWLCESKNRA